MHHEKLGQHFNNHLEFTKDEMAIILSYYHPIQIKKKAFLLESGVIPKYDCYVTKGCLRQYVLDASGKEHTQYFAVEDWWVNDIYAFLHQQPASANIQAIEDSEVLAITKADKDMLYDKIPKMERLYRIMIQKAFAALQKRMIDNLMKTADQRYVDYIEQYPHIASRLNNLQFASYLGISHEFLSKIKKRYKGRS